MDPIRTARARLAGAAWINRLDDLFDALRARGLEACFAQRDRMREIAAGGDWLEHRQYEREFMREVMLVDDPSVVILTDHANCRSAWLNARKLARLRTDGPVTPLFRQPLTRHLVELSPCAREYYRQREREHLSGPIGQPHAYAEHDARKSRELLRHLDTLVDLMRDLPAELDDVTLQGYAARHLAGVLAPLQPQSRDLPAADGSCPALIWPGTSDTYLIAKPMASVAPRSRKLMTTSGTLAIKLALITRASLDGPDQEREEHAIHLEEALPDTLRVYIQFVSRAELALTLLAWQHVLSLFLPPLIEALQRDTRVIAAAAH